MQGEAHWATNIEKIDDFEKYLRSGEMLKIEKKKETVAPG